MRIWLINHYAVPPQYYPLARPSLFARNLIKMGHEVTIIAASTVHNSDKNLIKGKEDVKKIIDDGIPYILIKCSDYQGNGLSRVVNILEFAKKLPRVLDTLDKPEAIVSTSFDPLSCYVGIKYAKKHGIKAIAEIADLWPETLVSYNGVNPKNPLVICLRYVEKNIYTKSDRIVFTMEGAYDYIVEQGWENEVPRKKVAYINNGIDLEQFEYNRVHYQIEDDDLKNPSTFKVVYAGAIRKVNNLSLLIDAAKCVKNKDVRFLIWGDGDDLERLRERVVKEDILNVVFKGRVQKKYIPYITSCADLNIAHGQYSPILRFGLSMNKMFDYLAAAKPILVDFHSPYDPAIDCGAAIESEDNSAEAIAIAVDKIADMTIQDRELLSKNAYIGAKKYDFSNLSKRLLEIICSI